MIIDKILLDNLTEQAKASPRLRMNYDLRDSFLALIRLDIGHSKTDIVMNSNWTFYKHLVHAKAG